MRSVKVIYGDGTTINTSMASHLNNKQILAYFRIGRLFNVGNVQDNLQPVSRVEIIK